MRTITLNRILLGALVTIGPIAISPAEDCVTVVKEVDQPFAYPSATLAYTITVANSCDPEVGTGLFTDDFAAELSGCTWTCSAASSAWCEVASGAGDIEQLISVPSGSSVMIDAVCTFFPSTGHECALNRAEFVTMDPDVLRTGIAQTCDWSIIIFLADFDSGNTSSWSETVP